MFDNILLEKAYQNHKHCHGMMYGMNFVECPRCHFHVHTGFPSLRDGPVWKHWNTPESYDRNPITDIHDARLAVVSRSLK